jgi:glycerophosphoryl diester phosphodiesterase
MGACSSDDGDGSPEPANLTVRRRIAALAPAAVFAHRGRGPTRAGNPYPENSLAAFRAALADHTDGLEMDVELTRDGRLILMHDDTVDRTTECRGCVSALDFDALRDCRLLGEDDRPSDQFPPTLDEVAELEPTDALLNVELKVFGDACTGPGHDAVDLATAMVAELRRLGIEHRTVVQSFDATALASVKAQAPDIYTAFLVTGLRPRDIDAAVEIGADALQPGGPFPFVNLAPELLAVAAAAGLQAIPWTVNDADSIHELLAAGVDGIITDEPGLAKSIVDARR